MYTSSKECRHVEQSHVHEFSASADCVCRKMKTVHQRRFRVTECESAAYGSF